MVQINIFGAVACLKIQAVNFAANFAPTSERVGPLCAVERGVQVRDDLPGSSGVLQRAGEAFGDMLGVVVVPGRGGGRGRSSLPLKIRRTASRASPSFIRHCFAMYGTRSDGSISPSPDPPALGVIGPFLRCHVIPSFSCGYLLHPVLALASLYPPCNIRIHAR